METNQQATANETGVWFEGQRKSGPNYGWITLVDADTREQAWARLSESYGATEQTPGFRVVRRRGQAS